METIRAIDVGYGNTKYVAARSDREIRCAMFPSVVPVASNRELAIGLAVSRDTVRLEIDGIEYEVGPGAHLGLRANNVRILHGDFARTPEYLALLRGALAYMDVPEIDLLVVGLPVSLMNSRAQSLARQLKGSHPVGNGRSVYVHHVLALAQPLGGFLDYAVGQGLYPLADQINLIIDLGFYTVDWLKTIGIQVLHERAGSFPGGCHAIGQAVARSLSETLQTDYTDISAIDWALEKGRLFVGGREIDIAPHRQRARARIREAVNAIANSVGDALDVSNIILVGGGARYYEDAIRERFPTPQLVVAPDPMYANVRGFQIAGEHHSVTAM